MIRDVDLLVDELDDIRLGSRRTHIGARRVPRDGGAAQFDRMIEHDHAARVRRKEIHHHGEEFIFHERRIQLQGGRTPCLLDPDRFECPLAGGLAGGCVARTHHFLIEAQSHEFVFESLPG